MKRARKDSDDTAERLARFLETLQVMVGAPNRAAFAKAFGISCGATYRYFAGSKNATARHVVTICDAVGINATRVILGPGPGRPWFIAPELAALDFFSPQDRGDVVKAIMDSLNEWQRRRSAA